MEIEMGDVIISITNRIVQRPNNGFCDELLNTEQLAALTSGCSRVLEALDPKLRLGVELIKITPWKAYDGQHGRWYYRYDAKVVLAVPEVQKFECELQFGVGPKEDLSGAFFLGAMESIRAKLSEYQRGLRAQVSRVQTVLPSEIRAK
jgi:hypothetical protein